MPAHFPDAFVESLESVLGREDAAAALEAMAGEASVSVRLNPFKAPEGADGLLEGASRVPWSPHGFILASRPSFTLQPLYHAGAYYVQDSSAMFVGELFRRVLGRCDDRPLRVLDLCAAPGGKTTDLAASLRECCGDAFLLVSNEVMRQRAGVLRDNVATWGDPNVVVTSVDPAAFARFEGFFDIILADVPCSGEGMFRKDAKAVEDWSPSLVELCSARQRRILADVWPALRKGGTLVYSTCTFEAAENDRNLEWAAERLGGGTDRPEEVFGLRTTPCGYMLVPGEVSGEGQWVGTLRKTSGSEGPGMSLEASRKTLSVLKPLLDGVNRGSWKGRDFVPSPDWALSLSFERGEWPEADVDRETALRFLHRDAICLPEVPKGYLVITYCGVPLGFVKNLGTRCNNLLPKSRRIRMDIV